MGPALVRKAARLFPYRRSQTPENRSRLPSDRPCLEELLHVNGLFVQDTLRLWFMTGNSTFEKLTHLVSRPLFLLAIFIPFLMLFARLGQLPLRDPDEGRNAEVAREMHLSGAWLVPTYNGIP